MNHTEKIARVITGTLDGQGMAQSTYEPQGLKEEIQEWIDNYKLTQGLEMKVNENKFSDGTSIYYISYN
jgi:hypothetical protein